jgi:beta-xylosidase
MQWGWNHNPEPSKWSLTEHPGYLRLKTATITDSLPKARNTLTQRFFTYYSDSLLTVGTTKIDLDHMKDGDIAGLAIFQDPYGFIGVEKINGEYYVIMVNNGAIIDSVKVNTSSIYLRADPFHGSGAAMYYGGETVDGTGTVTFAYSLDNKTFTTLGDVMQMQFKLTVFTGNKFCLFNYATEELGGYVDVDWFRVEARPKTTR